MAKFVKLSEKRIINIEKINYIFENKCDKVFFAAMDTCAGEYDARGARAFLVHLTEKEVEKIMKVSEAND